MTQHTPGPWKHVGHENCALCDEIERQHAALLAVLKTALSDQSFEEWKVWECEARAILQATAGSVRAAKGEN